MHILLILLFVTTLVSAAETPKSDSSRVQNENQAVSIINHINSQWTIKLRPSSQESKTTKSAQKSGQIIDSTFYGKDDRERLVAMCEAGFVKDCRRYIEEASSVENSPANEHKTQSTITAQSTISSPRSSLEWSEHNPVDGRSPFLHSLYVILVFAILTCCIHQIGKRCFRSAQNYSESFNS